MLTGHMMRAHIVRGHMLTGHMMRAHIVRRHMLTGHMLTAHIVKGHMLTGHTLTGHMLRADSTFHLEFAKDLSLIAILRRPTSQASPPP